MESECYYSQPICLEDFWHDLCQKYEFYGAILHDFYAKCVHFSAESTACYYERCSRE